MSNTYRLNGSPNPLQSIIRGFILIAAAIGGVFMLVFSAAIAFFVVAGVALFGLLLFVFFWAKAKITGKPFGPKAQFEAQRKEFEAQFGAQTRPFKASPQSNDVDGPVIDAHETPKGWSVDD